MWLYSGCRAVAVVFVSAVVISCSPSEQDVRRVSEETVATAIASIPRPTSAPTVTPQPTPTPIALPPTVTPALTPIRIRGALFQGEHLLRVGSDATVRHGARRMDGWQYVSRMGGCQYANRTEPEYRRNPRIFAWWLNGLHCRFLYPP